MELLYVWIGEYKNIEKQGFNFSPKYRFSFDEKTKTLSLDEDRSDKVIDKFFGERISNITAIVGENGSGKSSLIEYIHFLFNGGHHQFNAMGDMIDFQEKEEILCIIGNTIFTNIDGLNYNSQGLNIKKLEKYTNPRGVFFENFEKSNFLVHYTPVFDYRKITNKIIFDCSLRYELNDLLESKKTWISFECEELISQVKYTKFLFETIGKPEYYYFSFDLTVPIIYGYYEHTEKRLEEMVEVTKSDKDKVAFALFRHFIFCRTAKEDIRFENKYYEDKFNKRIDEIFSEEKNKDVFNFVKSFFKNESQYDKYEIDGVKYQSNLDIDFNKIEAFFDFFTLSLEKYSVEEIENKLKVKVLIDDIEEAALEFINYVEGLGKLPRNDIYSGMSIENPELSSGEKAFLNLFSKFYDVKKKIESDEYSHQSIIITIDEGELYLHPNWQKEFVSRLIENLPKIFADYKLQIILTTHSPFVLSDLPKENVVFLKNKEGKCEVQNGLESVKQTFGANIHTLLSDSFFMDGLAGKFSSDKINEVIKYLNGETVEGMNDGKAEKIINMIGEPILKRYLMQQLNLKKQNITFDKVKELENRIAELEKNQKDDKNQP